MGNGSIIVKDFIELSHFEEHNFVKVLGLYLPILNEHGSAMSTLFLFLFTGYRQCSLIVVQILRQAATSVSQPTWLQPVWKIVLSTKGLVKFKQFRNVSWIRRLLS